MNILDENILDAQRQLLRGWGISVRQIGHEVGRVGMKDEAVIPLLCGLRCPTFFTRDLGFYHRFLCHARYSLVCLAVGQYETAHFVRRVLRHPELDTQSKRMGTVMRVMHSGLVVWRLHAEEESHLLWRER